jgi:hypothetical protein
VPVREVLVMSSELGRTALSTRSWLGKLAGEPAV